MNAPAKPQSGLMDPKFQYRPAANTNVQETWKRFGWTPLSQKEVPNAKAQ